MRKISLFYKILFAVIAVWLVALIAGIFYLGFVLSDFEANQPDKIVQKMIDENLKVNGIKSLQSEYALSLSDYESEETIEQFYNDNIKGKTLAFGNISLKPENVDVAYAILADKDKIFDLYLKRNSDGDYKVLQTKINPKLLKSYTIKTGESTEILVNGKKVKAQDRKNAELPEVAKKLLQSQKATHKQYIELKDLLCEPKSVVAISNGSESKLSLNGDTYISSQTFNEIEPVSDLVFEGTSAYAAYMFNLRSIESVGAHFDTSTEFFKNLRATDVHYTLEYVNNKVTDFKINEMHKYSNSLYSCHVTFTNVLTRRDKEHLDYFNKFVYVKSTANGYKIIDMQNLELKR